MNNSPTSWQRKSIVLVQNVWFPQQWAIDIFYYAKYLSKNYDVKVIVSHIEEDISHQHLEILPIGSHSYVWFVYKAYFLIKQMGLSKSSDYVYFFAQHPFSVILQLLVKYLLQLRTVYDVVSGPIGTNLNSFIARKTIQLWVYLSYKYVVLHEWLIDMLKLPENKNYIVIPMWYDKEHFYEKKWANLFDKKRNELVFCYIGTLNQERRLDVLLKAFLEISEKLPNLKLYFIWSWSWEVLLKKIVNDSPSNNVFFLWKMKHSSIPDYINGSDVLVSYVPKVSYFEHQPPTKLLEYLACNKLVMATNTLAQEKILSWHDYMLHKDDFLSTAKKIREISSNFWLYEKRKVNDIVENYSREVLVEKLSDFIQD